MVEVKKDEIVVSEVEGKFQVQRDIIEEFEAREYLHRVQQLEQRQKQIEDQAVENKKLMGQYGALKEQAQKVYDAEIEKMKKEREEAVAKEKEKAECEECKV